MFASPKDVRTTTMVSQITTYLLDTPRGLIVYKYVSTVCKSKRCSHNNNIVLYACTEVKMSMYPHRNVHKSKNGSQDNCTIFEV